MSRRFEERGFAELFAVLFLAGLGLAWVALDLERRGREAERDRAYASGALFASWMQAAHRRVQEAEGFYVTALGGDPGVSMAVGQLRANGPVSCAPVGSVNCLGPVISNWASTTTALGQTIVAGVIDDGVGVPMAFVVARPDTTRGRSPLAGESFRAGATAGGVVGIEEFSEVDARWFELGGETFEVNVIGSTAPDRQDAIEHALGGSLAEGDLVAVADLGIVFNEAHVYRRRQPGREYLSEMGTDLRFEAPTSLAPVPGIPFERDAMGVAVADTGGGLVVAEFVETSGVFLVGKDASVGRDLTADTVDGAASVEADVVNVGKPEEPGALTLTGALEAGSLAVTMGLEAGWATVSGYLSAAQVNASVLLDGGPLLGVESDLRVTRELGGANVEASQVRGRSGGGLSGTFTATGTAEGTHGSAQELRIAGRLRVTDRCFGCGTP